MKKETTQYRLDNKLCTRCGEPVVPNRKMCSKHLEESRLKTKRRTRRWKDQNICTRCGQRPPRLGKTQCDICVNNNKDQYNVAKMDTYYQKRAAGVCVRCGKSPDSFSVHCDKCREYMRQKDRIRFNKSKEAGLCVHCHKSLPIKGEILCAGCKNKNTIRAKTYRGKQKLMILQHYGDRCQICGETDLDVLCIDHIDGGGVKHRQQLRSQGTTFYRWIIKNNYPTGFRTLCYNCNIKVYREGNTDSDTDDNGYTPVPSNRTFKVKTRYVDDGKGEPAEFVLDDD